MTNPISIVYNEYTVDSFDDIVYSPPQMSKWDYFWQVSWPRFWKSRTGHYLAIGLSAGAVVFSVVASIVFKCLTPMLMLATTAISGAITFLGGALISSLIGSANGHAFGKQFNDYITDNWAQTLAITALTFIATLAITVIANPAVLCFKEGTLVETEEGLKAIEEIQ